VDRQYDDQVTLIYERATNAFGYNPVKTIKCPHCDGVMLACDAMRHVEYAAIQRGEISESEARAMGGDR